MAEKSGVNCTVDIYDPNSCWDYPWIYPGQKTPKYTHHYSNNKIVCISSFFNPIHKGHIELINAAACYGKVIAIVNTDEQVKLKGSIPFQDQYERATIVNSIKNVYGVEYASRDKDETVCETLRHIKPDIFINSGDRKIADPRELEVCKEIGCQYLFIELPKIQSSSSLIKNAAIAFICRKLEM